MTEYPKGCILALKEIKERRFVFPGRNYVIEKTNGLRITKQVQLLKEGFVTCYSTNESKYADDKLIHAPFDISWEDIRRIYLVLGHIVNETNGEILIANK